MGGPAALALAGRPPGQVVSRALAALSELAGVPRRQLEGLVVGARTHDWSTDPWSRGAYSYATAGAEGVPRLLREPIQGTLFFAGEHTADLAELGTVQGALTSGHRAAQKLLAAARRPTTARAARS
jgi:monoamine oxidase